MISYRRGPSNFNVVRTVFNLACLSVASLYLVTIFKEPSAGTLRLIVVETALEVGPVRVDPLSRHHLSLHEVAYKFLTSFLKDIGALTVLLPVGPVARVHIVVLIGHNTLAVTLIILPVAVIDANVQVDLFANAALLALFPLARVSNGGCLAVTFAIVFEDAFTMAQLKQLRFNKVTTYTILPIALISVTIGVNSDCLTRETFRVFSCFSK